jgi:hypothetical protein
MLARFHQLADQPPLARGEALGVERHADLAESGQPRVEISSSAKRDES